MENIEAIKLINETVKENNLEGRYKLIFSKSVSICTSRINIRTSKEFSFKFFISKGGMLCYSVRGRTGYSVISLPFENFISIKKEKEVDPKLQRERDIKNLMKKFHPNLWQDIQNDYKNGNENPIGGDCKYDYRYLKYDFPQHVMENLKKAIENKEDFSYHKRALSPNGRDLSVTVKMEKDGIYRGFFSSEYYGCGNGDYYILINENIATFIERD